MARRYQLKRRAERQAQTRQRIVEAAVELHTTVGPSRTSIAAIAGLAGVERPTVYRHFPTEADLFRACSSYHWSEHPAPDPDPWREIADPEQRLRVGLEAMYAYYERHERGIWNILRDAEDSQFVRQFAAHRVAHRERVRDVLCAGWGARGRRARLVRAAVGHALDYFAWRSLRRQAISNAEVVELMTTLVKCAARTLSTSPAHGHGTRETESSAQAANPPCVPRSSPSSGQ
jgi:AcrR family transcriptional regulator